MKEILIISAVVLLIGLAVLIVRPFDVSRENSASVSGIVSSIHEAATFDMMIGLKDDPHMYYINRGFEHHFKLTEARQQLMLKPVVVCYARHWTPIDPTGHLRHITALVLDHDTIYKEF